MKILVFCVLGIISVITMGKFNGSKDSNKPKDPPKYKAYPEQWKKVDSLYKLGLVKDARIEIEKIYELAIKDNNWPQQYRAILILDSKVNSYTEDGLQYVIKSFEAKYTGGKEPLKSVLASVLGLAYFEMYRHNLYSTNGSNIVGAEQDESDLNTWSPQKLITKSNEYYLLSVRDAKLKEEWNYDLHDIMDGIGNDETQPYLYDVLIERAIEHFANAHSQLPNVKNNFSSDFLFSPYSEFINTKLPQDDEPLTKLVSLYQDAIRTQIDKSNEAAVIEYDLKRLESFYQSWTNASNEARYISALDALFYKYQSDKNAGNILVAKANLLYSKFNDNREPLINYGLQTDSILQIVIQKYPNCATYRNALYLSSQLHEKTNSAQIENVLLPNKPWKILMNFKNIQEIYLHVFKVDVSYMDKWNQQNHDRGLDFLKSQKHVITKKHEWQALSDLRNHQIELKMDGLDLGLYVLVTSNSKDLFQDTLSIIGNFFQVSNLAYIRSSIDYNQEQGLYIVDRSTGKPMQGVTCELFKYVYNQSPTPTTVVDCKAISAKDGSIVYTKDAEGHKLLLRYKDDKFYADDGFYVRSKDPSEDDNDNENYGIKKLLFFTDRSIYRPGQIIHFKLLVLDYLGLKSRVVANKEMSITLRNANHQELTKLTLRTNAFGSTSGEFVIPTNGLFGTYYLYCDNFGVSYNVEVEEYKRPNFEVIMDTTKVAYKLGEKIKFSGIAKSFSGVALDNVALKYRIYSQEKFPFFPCWCGYFGRIFNFQKEEIANGDLKTDKDGKFIIETMSKIIDKDEDINNVFQYTCVVDVVDVNGETQSCSSSIALAQKSFGISSNLNYLNLKDELKTINVHCKSIEGVNLASNLQIKILELKAPKDIMRKRLWNKPDIFIYSFKDYKSWFPEDIYKDEDSPTNWDIGKAVFEFNRSSQGMEQINLSRICTSGSFKISITAKIKNETVEFVDYFHVIDSKGVYPFLEPTMIVNNNNIISGQELKYIYPNIGRNFNLLENKNYSYAHENKWIGIKSNKFLSYKTKEKDKGGFGIGFASVLNNRFYFEQQIIDVPFQRELLITTKSFRDKLLPGAKEEWIFNIKDLYSKNRNAEVLASMYDASLDKIFPHTWNADIYQAFSRAWYASSNAFGTKNLEYYRYKHPPYDPLFVQKYKLNTSDIFAYFNFEPIHEIDFNGGGAPMSPCSASSRTYKQIDNSSDLAADAMAESKIASTAKAEESIESNSAIRSNLGETVFFYPFLTTNNQGDVTVKFTMNEALTKWKLNLFAHSKDLYYALKTLEVVTWKPLQIKPNYPRFIRQGDRIVLSTKLSNVTDANDQGTVSIDILDLNTQQSIAKELNIQQLEKKFNLGANQSKAFTWELNVPKDELRSYIIRFIANGKTHSDGEENIVPVLNNRMLVTETMPLPIKSNRTRDFIFKPLQKLSSSNTASPLSFTIERTSHPVWYAIQALPYLFDYPHQCAEQTTSRYFAAALGGHIMNKFPKVKSVMTEQLKNGEAKSPLEKNKELKSALLEETPWLLQAKSESESMANIALLMDVNNLNQTKHDLLTKLALMQYEYGAFPWFVNGPPDKYMTQHILTMLAQLYRINVISHDDALALSIMNKARSYTEQNIIDYYKSIEANVKANRTKWEDNHLDYLVLYFFRTESLMKSSNDSEELNKARDYFIEQIKTYWHNDNIYWEGLCALALNNTKKYKDFSKVIVESLKQRSILNDELGMYWKSNWGYYWYQLPVETQALMIEVFHDITNDYTAVDELKTWLLKNKQTNHWSTTKSTSAAIYSLLAYGNDYTSNSKDVLVSVNDQALVFDNKTTGSAYSKKVWTKTEIKPEFAKIKLTNPNNSIAWGAAYYQYFENLDKITSSNNSPLTLSKEIYRKSDSPKGKILELLSPKSSIKVGEVLTSRIIIKVDRDMEYIHLKDMRSAGLETINQLSGYKYQSGLSYYESPGDLATNFFISWLPKGTYVIEYDLRASIAGNFSNGISTIQSMYAPEFAAHSQGFILAIMPQ